MLLVQETVGRDSCEGKLETMAQGSYLSTADEQTRPRRAPTASSQASKGNVVHRQREAAGGISDILTDPIRPRPCNKRRGGPRVADTVSVELWTIIV
jgi:hypothetical protein